MTDHEPSAPPFTLGPAGAEDWAPMMALLQRSFAYMDGRIDPPSSLHRMSPAALAEKARHERAVVAKSDGQLVGCVFLAEKADAINIGKLAVQDAWRRRGLARALLDEAARLARRRGKPYLELQSRIELTETHQAFARLGFETVARTAHPGFDRPTSLTMRRAVPSALGDNGGPPLDDPGPTAPGVRWAYIAWRAAQDAAWRMPPETARRRARQAEACGVTFREYMLVLLNTGRHLQPDDHAAIAEIIARRPPSEALDARCQVASNAAHAATAPPPHPTTKA